MISTKQRYDQISPRLEEHLHAIAQRQEVKRETMYFKAEIGRVKSAEALVADRRVLSYVSRAFGLEDMAYAKAMLKQVMEQGTAREDSLANRVVDQRFKDLANTLNFDRFGSQATTRAGLQATIVNRYMQATLEQDEGRSDEGVRLALNFQRKVKDVRSVYGLLADRALFEVTKTALQLPRSMSSLDIDKQAKMIADKISVSDLKDPEKLRRFLTRFTTLWDLANSHQRQAASELQALFSGPTTVGVGDTLLQRLQPRSR